MKYYEFDCLGETEKAYQMYIYQTYRKVVKCDDGVYRSLENFSYLYVPKSQCKEVEGRTYIKSWLVAKNNWWKYVSPEATEF